MTRHMIFYMVISLWLLSNVFVAGAQPRITQDDVNAVAQQMYCPVCENIPLDDCGTPTCNQWKEEIAIQLSEGRTAQEIIDNFVARYGQHVVGIPQDSTLRLMSFIVPLLGVVMAGGIGVMTFMRWRNSQPVNATHAVGIASAQSTSPEQDDAYRSLIEQDLN